MSSEEYLHPMFLLFLVLEYIPQNYCLEIHFEQIQTHFQRIFKLLIIDILRFNKKFLPKSSA